MRSKRSTRSRRAVLDSDDNIDGSANRAALVMDNDDDTEASPPFTPVPRPRPADTRDDYNAFLRQTVELYSQEGDVDFAPEYDNTVEIVDEEEDSQWVEGNDVEPSVYDDSDWAEVIANDVDGSRFLPPFLDRTAKLDKDYPTVETYLQDHEAEITAFNAMVASACRFVKDFTRQNVYDEFMKAADNDQAIHPQWFKMFCNVDTGTLGDIISQCVPVQAAATMGRVDFGGDDHDLERLPHFPPIKVFGSYFNDITKTFSEDRGLAKFAYHGVSIASSGVVFGRIQQHLAHLRKNYQDLPDNEQTLHYEEGCTDACPEDWDVQQCGTWQPRWDCKWDFRATSMTYRDDMLADVHQLLEGILQGCFNMVVFDHPTRPRSRKNSHAVERFVRGMRMFIEADLGRKLPDLQYLALNRSFPLAEPRRTKASATQSKRVCAVKGCKSTTNLLLSVMGDPYCDRVCLLHYGDTDAFLSRPPCASCGVQRGDTVSAHWSPTLCPRCRQQNVYTSAKWLDREPCKNCGVPRAKSVGGLWNEKEGICSPCNQWALRNNNQHRSAEAEMSRQVIISARALEKVGGSTQCSNCGVACTKGKGSTIRCVSKKDSKLRCRLCHIYTDAGGTERPFHLWNGMEALGSQHHTEFKQWNDSQQRNSKTCECGKEKTKRQGKVVGYLETCRSCHQGAAVHTWPQFRTWVTSVLEPRAIAAGKSLRDLFKEVRTTVQATINQDERPPKRIGALKHGRKPGLAVDDEEEDVHVIKRARPAPMGLWGKKQKRARMHEMDEEMDEEYVDDDEEMGGDYVDDDDNTPSRAPRQSARNVKKVRYTR